MARREIFIPPQCGARVYVNERGEVVLEQSNDLQESVSLYFQPEEAKRVAAAIVEVAEAAAARGDS
jgi:hypothetical protein